MTMATLPPLPAQAERLISLGVHELAGLAAGELRALARAGVHLGGHGLLIVHPDRVPVSALAPLIRYGEKPGFVVADMTDVDEFRPLPEAPLPDGPGYLLDDPCRHDEMLNWSPDQALPALRDAGRTPLTLGEGLHWLLHCPDVLQRGRCFMTIGSRRLRHDGRLDPRTPAIWISNGTGRDGARNRHAAKIGWCWAGNRHTWLGFASAGRRRPVPAG